MNEYKTSGGITIQINDDGSITQVGSFDCSSCIGQSVTFSTKPQIGKFSLSSDSMKCGENVDLSWNIIDGEDNTLTIEQGTRTQVVEIPNDGRINIISNLDSNDIDFTICSSNSCGKVYARRTLHLSKQNIDFKTTKISSVATVFYTILLIIILIVAIIRLGGNILSIFI